MSGSLSVAIAASLALLASAASAQEGADPLKSAAEAAIRRGSVFTLANACFAAAGNDESAVTLDVEILPASRLVGGRAVATRANPVTLGSVAFKGQGIVITSSDPRFDDLIVDPIGSTPRLPDGRRLVMWNLVHAETGGQCRLPLHDRGTQGWPSQSAANADAHPQIPGYVEVASWPFGYNSFVGLMRSGAAEDRTLIVTFAAGPQHNTRILAEVPLALQSIMVQPPMHGGPSWTLAVIGRQGDGSIVEALLDTDRPSR